MTEVKEMNVYGKLAVARAQLQSEPLKKSGVNKYAGFNYFELGDFLPRVNKIFSDIGLCSVFNIIDAHTETAPDGTVTEENKKAILIIINADKPVESITFSSPVAEATMKGATPIQMLGSEHTYMRRYLWLEAMEITENDGMDAVSGKDAQKGSEQSERVRVETDQNGMSKNVPLITAEQKHWMNTVLDREQRQFFMDKLNIVQIDQMSKKDASDIMVAYAKKHGGQQA